MNLKDLMKNAARRAGYSEEEILDAMVEEVRKEHLVIEFEHKTETVNKLIREFHKKKYHVPKALSHLLRVQKCTINLDYKENTYTHYQRDGSFLSVDPTQVSEGPMREKEGLYVGSFGFVEKEDT